jgi:hypothetical protein
MTRVRRLGVCALSLLLLARFTSADSLASPGAVSTVGMPAKVGPIVIQGAELEVIPLADRRASLVLRIAEVYPHGTAMRYEFLFYGLEPGSYDLAKYLRRKDGSALGELPQIQVRVDPVLPPGQIEPHPLNLLHSPWLGGYRLLLAMAGSLWCAGLAAILLWGRGRRGSLDQATAKPLTFADRLTPLVTAAMEGTLSQGQQAELERMLIGYWRKRLKLDHVSPAQAMKAMKEHPEAGPLIRQLEEWLHRPGRSTEVSELAALLTPYRALSDDTGDLSAPDEPSSRVRQLVGEQHR